MTCSLSINGSNGLGVYLDTNGNGKLDVKSDELIAHLVGVNTLDQADVVLV